MGFLDYFRKRKQASPLAALTRGSILSIGWNDDDGGSSTLTPDAALKFPPVWYAVSRISRHVGQLPLVIHKRIERGADRDPKHPAYSLLKTQPNPFQTAIIFKEQLQVDALLWGNGRAAIVRDAQQRPVELIPLDPRRSMTAIAEGEKWHSTYVESGSLADTKKDANTWFNFRDEDVIHVQGLGTNGIAGKPITDYAAESLGLGLAAEKQAKAYFDNGARPGIILEAPAGAFRSEKDAAEFLEAFNKRHSSSMNAGRVGLLREGIKATTLSVPSSDGQHLENRKYSRQDAALWFLLESILGDGESNSYSTLEQKHLAYLTNCLMPWLVKWEEQVNAKLLSVKERRLDSHFAKFNVAALLRADMQTQVNTLGNAIRSRIINPNEAREKLDMNPYEGGDEFENPAITPGGQAVEDEPADEEANQARRNAAARAVQSRLDHLAGVEMKRVRAAIAAGRDLPKWGDTFYAKWLETLSACADEMGWNVAYAEDHAERAKEYLAEPATAADNIEASLAVMSAYASKEAQSDRV